MHVMDDAMRCDTEHGMYDTEHRMYDTEHGMYDTEHGMYDTEHGVPVLALAHPLHTD